MVCNIGSGFGKRLTRSPLLIEHCRSTSQYCSPSTSQKDRPLKYSVLLLSIYSFRFIEVEKMYNLSLLVQHSTKKITQWLRCVCVCVNIVVSMCCIYASQKTLSTKIQMKINFLTKLQLFFSSQIRSYMCKYVYTNGRFCMNVPKI